MKLDPLEERIIYHLMIQNGPITVAELADFCNVSANSIRNRIPYLNRKIFDSDLKIVMKRSVGCELHKISEEKNEEQKYYDLRFDLNRMHYTSRTDRIDVIIRRLLCSQEYLPIQTVCDMLYYSYSELHRDIASANEYLEKFNLKILTRRSKGLHIEGSEMNKRICLVFQHKRFRYLDEETKKNEPWFSAIFDNSLKIEIVQDMLIKILEKYPHYAYSHINFSKIANMIYVMKARQKYSPLIRFPENVSGYIRSQDAYEIAGKLLDVFSLKIGFTPYEEDRLCLALVLESYRSIRNLDDLKDLSFYDRLISESRSILNEISLRIFGETLKQDDLYFGHFSCTLYTAWILTMTGMPLDEEVIYPLQDNFAISADFAVALYHIMKERYGYSLSPSLLKYMCYTMRICFRDSGKKDSKFRLLVYSIYGIEYARYVASNIHKVYKNGFSEIVPIESTPELHSEKLGEYDLLLMDNSAKNLQKINESFKLPTIWLPISNYPRHYHELDEWLLNQQNSILKEILKGRVSESSCTNISGIYQVFYDLLKEDLDMNEEEFFRGLEEREKIFPTLRGKRVAYLTVDSNKGQRDLLAVLINKKPVPWYGNTKAQFFIFYDFNNTDHHKRRFIMDFLKMFLRQQPADLMSLTQKDDDEIISFIMKNNDRSTS